MQINSTAISSRPPSGSCATGDTLDLLPGNIITLRLLPAELLPTTATCASVHTYVDKSNENPYLLLLCVNCMIFNVLH